LIQQPGGLLGDGQGPIATLRGISIWKYLGHESLPAYAKLRLATRGRRQEGGTQPVSTAMLPYALPEAKRQRVPSGVRQAQLGHEGEAAGGRYPASLDGDASLRFARGKAATSPFRRTPSSAWPRGNGSGSMYAQQLPSVPGEYFEKYGEM